MVSRVRLVMVAKVVKAAAHSPTAPMVVLVEIPALQVLAGRAGSQELAERMVRSVARAEQDKK